MTRRCVALILMVLLTVAVACGLMAWHGWSSPWSGVAATGDSLVGSDARTMGLISLPLVVMGAVLMKASRHGVNVYQKWCSSEHELHESPGDPGGHGPRAMSS